MTKILIIQTAFIGDVILATALVEQIKAHFPEAQIDFLLRKGNESLLTNHPFIHRLYVFDKKNKRASFFENLKSIRAARYDILFNLQRYFSAGLFAMFSKARVKIGFDKNPLSFFYTKRIKHIIGDGSHEIDRNLKLLTAIFDDIKGRKLPRLYPADTDYQNLPTAQTYVCFAPASVWATKQLPPHKWVELAKKIPTDQAIYLIGAKSDAALCEQIITQAQRANMHNSAGKFSFLQSAALMQQATMNYVNDSAPLHIASAVNAPVTAFFCSTVPSFGFTPLSDVSVIKEVATGLDCRPCGLHGYKSCPKGHFKCGEIEL